MVGTYDVINIEPGTSATRGMPSLTTVPPTLKFEDAKAIAREVNGITAVAEVQNAFDLDVKYRDKTTAVALYGISANWLEMHSYFIDAGNVFSTNCRSTQRSCFDVDMGELRYSVGVGATWITGFGPITFSVAQPFNSGEFDQEEVFQFTLGRGF